MDFPSRVIGPSKQLLRRATVDTDAIQELIDKLPFDGGTVEIPSGDWLIDCQREIKLRSNLRLLMKPDTNLIALPNGLPRYGLLDFGKCSDVEVFGGNLIGDRDFHDYSAAGTHEWGHGMQVYDCQKVTIRDTKFYNFPGDGLSLGSGAGARDIVIANIETNNCRRQGLSIVHAQNVLVYESRFFDTNGTSPECGIDIEPEARQWTKGIRIERCMMRGNKKYGVNVLQRADGGIVDGVDIIDCDITGQVSNGVALVGGKNVRVLNSRITGNTKTGIDINNTVNYLVQGNTFAKNYGAAARTIPMLAFKGWKVAIQKDVYLRSGTPATGMLANDYR